MKMSLGLYFMGQCFTSNFLLNISLKQVDFIFIYPVKNLTLGKSM